MRQQLKKNTKQEVKVLVEEWEAKLNNYKQETFDKKKEVLPPKKGRKKGAKQPSALQGKEGPA